MKYNYNKLVEKLQSMTGETLCVDIEVHNGCRNDGKIYMSSDCLIGKLDSVVKYKSGLVLLEMCGRSFALISTNSNPIYQTGVSSIKRDGEVVYQNLGIKSYKGQFLDKVKDVFDQKSVEYLTPKKTTKDTFIDL